MTSAILIKITLFHDINSFKNAKEAFKSFKAKLIVQTDV